MVKTLKPVMAILAILVGLYPLIYLFADRKFGLLCSKSVAVLTDVFWNIGFNYCFARISRAWAFLVFYNL